MNTENVSTDTPAAVVNIGDPEAPHPAAQNPLHRLATMRQIVDATKLKDSSRTFEPTGKFFILCNCGFASGWIGPDEFTKELVAEHTGEPDVRGYAEVVEELNRTAEELKFAKLDLSELRRAVTEGQVFGFDEHGHVVVDRNFGADEPDSEVQDEETSYVYGQCKKCMGLIRWSGSHFDLWQHPKRANNKRAKCEADSFRIGEVKPEEFVGGFGKTLDELWETAGQTRG